MLAASNYRCGRGGVAAEESAASLACSRASLSITTHSWQMRAPSLPVTSSPGWNARPQKLQCNLPTVLIVP